MKLVVSVRCIAAVFAMLASCGIGHAVVVFSESGSDTLIKGVVDSAANVHMFSIDTPGAYQATIVDLASLDDTGFADQFTKLNLAITAAPSKGLLGSAGLPPASSTFDFVVANPGTFAALVHAVSGCADFGFYEINIAQILPVPSRQQRVTPS